MNISAKRRSLATAEQQTIKLRTPRPEDGPAVTALIAACPPLDPNSAYCNLLQCSHFSATSIIAEGEDGQALGFISGYRIPERPDTLFVWQVAVSSAARGQGLGKRMLLGLLERPDSADLRFMETTITPDNEASWAMFRSLARGLGAEVVDSTLFDSTLHFNGQHASESLLRIGPFTTNQTTTTDDKQEVNP